MAFWGLQVQILSFRISSSLIAPNYGFRIIYISSHLLAFLFVETWLEFINFFEKALFNTYQISAGTDINFAV